MKVVFCAIVSNGLAVNSICRIFASLLGYLFIAISKNVATGYKMFSFKELFPKISHVYFYHVLLCFINSNLINNPVLLAQR